MNMQFAGLEKFMNNDQYNQGDVAMAAGAIDSALRRFNTGLEKRIGSTALGYEAEDRAQDILDSAGSYAKGKGGLINIFNTVSQAAGPIAGAFGPSSFAATEGVNPQTIVDSFGGQASGLPGNDFYVDASGSIFANPT